MGDFDSFESANETEIPVNLNYISCLRMITFPSAKSYQSIPLRTSAQLYCCYFIRTRVHSVYPGLLSSYFFQFILGIALEILTAGSGVYST